MTRTQPPRDLEKLSAYLDGQLSPNDTQALETRLSQEPNLRQALEDLRQTKNLLRLAPKARRPRNFTLSPEIIRKRVFISRGYQTMRLVSAAASVLFVIVFVGDTLAGSTASKDVAFPGEATYSDDAGDGGAVAMQEIAENQKDENGDMANADMDVVGDTVEAESLPVEEPMAPEEPAGGGAPETAVEKSGEDETMADDADAAPAAAITETQPPPGDMFSEGIGGTEPQGAPSDMPMPSPTLSLTEPAMERTTLEDEADDDAGDDMSTHAEKESIDEVEEKVALVEVKEKQVPLLNFAKLGLILIALLSGGIAYLIRRRAG